MSGYIPPLLADTQWPLPLLPVKQHGVGRKKWAEEEEESMFKSQLFIWEPITLLTSVSSSVKWSHNVLNKDVIRINNGFYVC